MTKNIAASVRARLLNLAKAQGVDFSRRMNWPSKRCRTSWPCCERHWNRHYFVLPH